MFHGAQSTARVRSQQAGAAPIASAPRAGVVSNSPLRFPVGIEKTHRGFICVAVEEVIEHLSERGLFGCRPRS